MKRFHTLTVAALGVTIALTLTSDAVGSTGRDVYGSWMSVDLGSRTAPRAPWAAGGRLLVRRSDHRGGMLSCTLNVPWKLPDGTRGILTAGHCFTEYHGTEVDTYRGNGDHVDAVTGYIGTITRTSLNAAGRSRTAGLGDLAFIRTPGPTALYLFTGGANGTDNVPISGLGVSTTDMDLCVTAATTGTLCGFRLRSYRDNNVSEGNFTGLTKLYKNQGKCSAEGDSGGAVFYYRGGQAVVVGVLSMLSGNFANAYTWRGHGYPCWIEYTPISKARGAFGGSLSR